MLSGESGFFWQRYSLKTMFGDVAGLKAGAPVRVAGRRGRGGHRGRLRRRPRRGRPGDQEGASAAHHDRVEGDARRGVAARRGGGGHHRVESRHAAPGVGLHPDRAAARCRLRKSGRRPAQRLQEATRLLQDIRAGRGTLGQAGHRRCDVPGPEHAAAVGGSRRQPDRQRAGHARTADQRPAPVRRTVGLRRATSTR